jgi:trk system potassium uptake protein TrkA
VGVAIRDLPLPEKAVIAAIFRRHDMVVPRGDTVFAVGDEVLAVCDPAVVEQLAALFSVPKPRDAETRPRMANR